MPFTVLSAGFQSLSLLLISKLGPSGADSQMGVGSRTLRVSPKNCPVRGVSLAATSNPHRCFQPETLRLYFPVLEPWVA